MRMSEHYYVWDYYHTEILLILNEGNSFNIFAKMYYSAGQKKRYKYCFMKQKFQIQMGIAQYKNAAIPLAIKDIDTTQQHFQMRYVTLF